MNTDMIEIKNQTNKGEIKMKKMKHILKNEKGLTLIELLAVIVILAIVAAIAVPAIGNIIEGSRDKAILADASTILSGAKLAVTSGDCTETDGDYACTFEDLNPEYVGEITPLKDEAKTPATYSVALESDVWTVTFNKLGDLSDDDEYSDIKTDKNVTETALNEALNK